MNNSPIGFFDSGLGGLTCIPHLMKSLPLERVIYFGDTARTPYGSKAVSTIRSFSLEIADFLVHKGVKHIVIACNTVSATSLEELRSRYPDLSFTGIIEPAARATAEAAGVGSRIGVIGTKVTVRSGVYEREIRSVNPELQVFSKACPAFVPLIEEGIIDNEIMDLTIRYYLDDFVGRHAIDTLVLGCTHYPMIRANLQRLYPGLSVIDPSEIVVETLAQTLREQNRLAGCPNGGNTFYASDLSENFLNMIDAIFREEPVKVRFKNFDLEEVRKESR